MTEAEAIEIAKDYVAEYAGIERNTPIVKHSEKDIEMEFKLTDSVYFYEIVLSDESKTYEVEVHSTSGYAHIEDIGHERSRDRDR